MTNVDLSGKEEEYVSKVWTVMKCEANREFGVSKIIHHY